MWKNFFFFSKPQRRGIILLTILVVLAVVLNFALPLFFSASNNENADFIEEVSAFKQSLVSRDSLKHIEQERIRTEREAQYKNFGRKETEQNYSLFTFDPNTADSTTFVKLGIRPSVAGNIVRYRNRGGKFRTTDDFRKTHGISDAKFDELNPYIVIREERKDDVEKTLPKETSIGEIIVELNSADTTELMKIKGIGHYYAREIVKYRKDLGGFFSIEQLLEVKNMHPENFEKIAPFCTVNESKIDKIAVNTASVDYMKQHPYLNFYQAKAIYELRRTARKLNNIDELAKLSEFSEEDFQRLIPYLNFE